MYRLIALLSVFALVVPLGAGAEPTVDSEDIDLVFNDPYTNGTDTAFDGNYVYAGKMGSEGGVGIYDVSDPDEPVKVGFIRCPGSQNDVAVVEPGIIALAYHNEIGPDCPNATLDADGEPTRSTAGVRLYDVSDPEEPVALGVSPRLPGGTHTITVHPSGDYIYASPGGLANGGGTQQILDISDREGPFPVHTFQPNETGCHDFGFFTSVDDREMGVCVGLSESQIWDLTDPTSPEIVSSIVNPLVFFDHTGIVTDDGRYLVLGDEAFGAHDCVGGPAGALWLYDISTPEVPVPLSYFGIDRATDDMLGQSLVQGVHDWDAWCTAHLYNFIPGTRILVTSWYSGGINIIDWTDVLAPREIAHFRMDGDRSAREASNYWSAYWHDGRIYANDLSRGFDALEWTAFDEHFGDDEPTAEEITAFVQAQPDSSRDGWHAGRFFDTPTAEQATWLAQRTALLHLQENQAPACRLPLLQ